MRLKQILAATFVLLGCGGSQPETAVDGKQGPQVPAKSEGGSGNVAPDAPEASTHHGTQVEPQLVTSGQDPIQVTYNPTIGETQRLILTVLIRATTEKKRLPPRPRTRLVLDTQFEKGTNGTWRRSFEVKQAEVIPTAKVSSEAREAMQAQVTGLIGRKGHIEVSAEGRTLAYLLVGGIPTEADQMQRELFAALETALRHHVIELPPEPIGQGGSWTAGEHHDLYGLDLTLNGTFNLVKKRGDQVEIDATLTPESVPIGYKLTQLQQPVMLSTLSHQVKWKARIDTKAVRPIESHYKVNGKFEGLDDASELTRGKLEIDVWVEEDYLALNDERVQLKGRFVQGGLVHGTVPPGSKVWFRRKRVKVSPEGDFIIGFGRNAGRRALLSFELPGGAAERHVVHVMPRDFEPESIEGLPPEMVDPDKETKKALAKSRKAISRARSKNIKEPYYRDGFIWPARGKITSTYGRERTLNGKDKGIHWGVDIAGKKGKKIRAPAAGVVVFAEKDVPLSGNLLIIAHGHGLSSSFLHLQKIRVKVGDVVKQGQVIATLGNTGRSTGPHLDWRMNLRDIRVDPQTVTPTPKP